MLREINAAPHAGWTEVVDAITRMVLIAGLALLLVGVLLVGVLSSAEVVGEVLAVLGLVVTFSAAIVRHSTRRHLRRTL